MAALLARLETTVVKPGDALCLAGDFNSLPDSGVHELCTTGSLPLHHEHARAPDVRIQPPLPREKLLSPGRSSGYRHGLGLSSAYQVSESVSQ